MKRYRTILCGGGNPVASPCPSNPERQHDPMPLGYTDAAIYADKMLKTHTQRRCPDCDLYGYWEPKPICQGCRHAKRNHISGEGLCLVKSCHGCLIYQAPALSTSQDKAP